MSLDLKTNIPKINLSVVKAPAHAIYAFEDFLLDAEHLMLYRGGAEIPLTPKQVETLLALVERHGAIVSKDALMTRLWGDSAVEETNLIQNIHVLRKVLSETSDGRPMIETLRRRGYRFNGKLNDHAKAEANAEIQHAQTQRPISREFTLVADRQPVAKKEGIAPSTKTKPALVIIGAMAMLGVAVLGFLLYRSTPAVPSDTKLFAVLPIQPIDNSNRSDLYENGIADALINRINSIDGLQARPLTATRNYAAIDQDPVVAGREQKADYVVTGSYQIADGKIRITSQLINVGTGQTEESFTFENPASGVFEIQDAMASEFGNRLIERFNTKQVGSVAWRGTKNEEAYRLYLQGMKLYSSRRLKPAAEAFEEAVRLDPKYARAWAGVAHAAMVYSRGRAGRTDEEVRRIGKEERDKASDAINKALTLDPGLSDAYSALCEQKTWYEWDFRNAEHTCKRAVELDPRSSLAHQNYSGFLLSRGRFDEAIAEIKLAIDLEPGSSFNQRLLGDTLTMARRYDEAETQLKRLFATDKDFANAALWASMTCELNGKEPEAFEYWIMNSELKDTPDLTQAYKVAYQTSGWQGFLKERAAQFERSGRNYYQGAAFHALIADKDRAFEYLERSFANREWTLTFLEVDPRLDVLRDDARYRDLVKRFNGS